MRKSSREYWIDPESGISRSDFDLMYQDLVDPWGCHQALNSPHNHRFLDLIFHDGQTFRKILDVGCGLGGLTHQIMKRNGYGGLVTGIDISKTAVNKAKSRYPECNFLPLDICSDLSDNHDGTYDLVVLSEIIWYVADSLSKVLNAIRQMLVPSGGAFLAVKLAIPQEQQYHRHIRGIVGFLDLMTRNGWEINRKVVLTETSESILLAIFSPL